MSLSLSLYIHILICSRIRWPPHRPLDIVGNTSTYAQPVTTPSQQCVCIFEDSFVSILGWPGSQNVRYPTYPC